MAHHILVQTALFLAVGLIERVAGNHARHGSAVSPPPPVLAILFFIPAMNLAGVPPLSGFLGKVACSRPARRTARCWPDPGRRCALTSLLTLYVVARVWTKAFWRSRADAPEGHLAAAAPEALLDDSEDVAFADRGNVGRMPVGMLAPTGALIAVGLTLTVLAGPIVAYTDRAAGEVLDRGNYISAVLGGDPS